MKSFIYGVDLYDLFVPYHEGFKEFFIYSTKQEVCIQSVHKIETVNQNACTLILSSGCIS